MRERAAGAVPGAGEERVDGGEYDARASVSVDAGGVDLGAECVFEVCARRRERVADNDFDA